MKRITRDELRRILLGQTYTELRELLTEGYSKEEILDLILSEDAKDITTKLQLHKWDFLVVND